MCGLNYIKITERPSLTIYIQTNVHELSMVSVFPSTSSFVTRGGHLKLPHISKWFSKLLVSVITHILDGLKLLRFIAYCYDLILKLYNVRREFDTHEMKMKKDFIAHEPHNFSFSLNNTHTHEHVQKFSLLIPRKHVKSMPFFVSINTEMKIAQEKTKKLLN